MDKVLQLLCFQSLQGCVVFFASQGLGDDSHSDFFCFFPLPVLVVFVDVAGFEAAAPFKMASSPPAPFWAQRVDAFPVAFRAWWLAFWVSAAAAYSEVVEATNAFPPTIPHDAWLTTVVIRAVVDTVSCHVG